MPNWAYTQYVISGEEKTVNKMKTILDKLAARKESLLENGFGKLWLGNIVKILRADWNKVYCRGEITDYELDTSRGVPVLKINTETAWGEMNEVRELLLSRIPGLRILFYTEEQGMEIYNTNDEAGEWFPERFVLDSDEEGEEYLPDIESVIEYLNAYFPGRFPFTLPCKRLPTFEELKSAISDWNDDNEDQWMAIHQIRIEND